LLPAVVQLAAEKDKLIAELNAQKDHLTTRNEEQAAEIESLKEQLSERESSQALLALKGSGLQSTQSGKVSSFSLEQ
jgi:predicted nuclease with TOPRIM domain